MKTQSAFSLVTLTLGMFLSIILGAPAACAQNELVLSGSTLKSEDIATKVDIVFVGEITDPGLTLPTSPGMASYNGIQVKVIQFLRGSFNAQTITIKLDILAANREEPPKVGAQYILFVKKDGNRFTALKLLPSTDDQIAKVKALIAATPLPK
jgi:hypothetical protein